MLRVGSLDMPPSPAHPDLKREDTEVLLRSLERCWSTPGTFMRASSYTYTKKQSLPGPEIQRFDHRLRHRGICCSSVHCLPAFPVFCQSMWWRLSGTTMFVKPRENADECWCWMCGKGVCLQRDSSAWWWSNRCQESDTVPVHLGLFCTWEANTGTTRNTRSQRRKSQAENVQHVDPLCFHVWIYALADRLLIEGLKVLAGRYFHELLESSLDSPSFARAVEEVYSSTPPEDRGLRDLVIQVTLKNLSTLRRTGSLSDDLFRNVPDFAVDFSIAKVKKYTPPSGFRY